MGILDEQGVSNAKYNLRYPTKCPNRSIFENRPALRAAAIKPLTVQKPTVERNTEMQKTLSRWEPLQEMEEFQNRLSTFFGRPQRRGNGREEITLPEWTPLADITEDEKEYLIKAELPEMKKEDVKVTVENGVLTISGERKFEKEEKNKKYHRVERGYGAFMRSFTLPDDADGNKIKAEFKNGLLKVHLPKSEHAKPKQIEVNVA
jgi:HSP20 family protein